MARTINTEIRVTGEKAFNNSMKEINSTLRVLNSALSLSEAQFRAQGSTVDSLKAKLKSQKELYAEQTKGIEELTKAMNGVEKGSEKYKKYELALNNAKTAHTNLGAEISRTEAELKRESAVIDDTSESLQEMGGNPTGMNAWGIAVGNILADVARKGAELIKTIGEVGIKYNAEMEKYTTAMTTALGSAEDAASAISQIKLDAAFTPYSMASLTQANMLLISTGESAGDARETIMALSNAVSATGGGNDELQRMALNLQQVKNTGKAAAIDIKQFAMAGIDIYGLLADYTGKSTEEVKDLTVTYDMLSKALIAASQEGGRYFGANEAQSRTLNGQISTLTDNVKSKLGEAFKGVSDTLSNKLLPTANKFVNDLDVGKVIDDFERLVKVAVVLGGAFEGLKIGNMVGEFTSLVAATKAKIGTDEASITVERLHAGSLTAEQIAAGALSGALDKAAIKQYALNTAVALFPGAILATVAGIFVAAAQNFNSSVDDIKSRLDELPESVDGCKTEIEALNVEIDRIREGNVTIDEMFQEDAYITAYGQRIQELEGQIASLEAAEAEAAAQEAEHAAYLETTEGKCETLSASILGLCQAYEAAYDSAKEALSGQFDLFDKAEIKGKLSVDQMFAGLYSQRDYWKAYGDNLNQLQSLSHGTIGLSEELIANLGDGSAESVAYAASIVEAFQKCKDDSERINLAESLNKAFEEQQKALDSSAQAMAEYQTNFSESLDELVKTVKDGAEDMNQSAEFESAGRATLEGYISGLDSQKASLIAKLREIAREAANSFYIPLKKPGEDGTGGNSGGSTTGNTPTRMATGANYIPYDEYPALLHKGEMVLTAREADAIRAAGVNAMSGRNSLIVNVYPQDMSPAQVDYLIDTINRELGK